MIKSVNWTSDGGSGIGTGLWGGHEVWRQDKRTTRVSKVQTGRDRGLGVSDRRTDDQPAPALPPGTPKPWLWGGIADNGFENPRKELSWNS